MTCDHHKKVSTGAQQTTNPLTITPFMTSYIAYEIRLTGVVVQIRKQEFKNIQLFSSVGTN